MHNFDSTVCVIENPSFRDPVQQPWSGRASASNGPPLPACQPASLPAAHLQPAAAPSLPDPSGPWHQLAAPTCGSSLHQAADSDLSLSFNFSNFKFKFQLFKFQVFKFQVVMFSSWQTFKSSQIPHPRLTVWNAPPSAPVCKREKLTFNYVYVCFQNHDHRTWRKCST